MFKQAKKFLLAFFIYMSYNKIYIIFKKICPILYRRYMWWWAYYLTSTDTKSSCRYIKFTWNTEI